MTLVILMQALVATLAVLMLIEMWPRRHAPGQRSQIGIDTDGFAEFGEFVEFHPELLIRWDDEAHHHGRHSCTRVTHARGQHLRPAFRNTTRSRTFER